MKTFKKAIIFLVCILLLLVIRTLWKAGTFKTLQPHSPAKTQIIRGMTGAEDITIDPATGLALVSSHDRRKTRVGEAAKGAIYQLDFMASPPKIIDLTVHFDQPDFHPHGISLFTDLTDGTKWLFVINHRDSVHCVEIFQYTDSTLVHSETIKSTLLVSPNDVVGVGKRAFYFTNDHDEKSGISSLKDFLIIGTGQVGFYDGNKVEILEEGIRYANGINVSKDGKHLYVAACTDGSIGVYERSPFRKISQIDCGTGVDNLEWDEQGNLWTAAHPKMLAFLGHAKKAENRSPSQVLKISFENPEKPLVEEIYLNYGDPLSGSSVAAAFKNQILVGTVFEDGIIKLIIDN